MCAGPFKFVERVQQDRIVLEKFAGYWNAANVHIDRIVFRPIVESTVRLANLKSGSLDLIERALATDLPEIKADPKLKLATQIEIGYQGLTLNLANGEAGKNGPFGKDPRVRQALEAAIDRKAISDVVFNGEVLPGNQWVSPKSPYYQQQFPVPGRDVAKAKKLLADAGHGDARGRRLHGPQQSREPAGRRGDAGHGEGCGLRHEDPRHRVCHLAQGGRGGALPGLFHRLERPHRSRRQQLHLPQMRARRRTTAHFCSKDVDQWLDDARKASKLEERKAIYAKIADKYLKEGSIIYLYHRLVIIAHSAKLEGYAQLPDGLVRVVGVKLKP